MTPSRRALPGGTCTATLVSRDDRPKLSTKPGSRGDRGTVVSTTVCGSLRERCDTWTVWLLAPVLVTVTGTVWLLPGSPVTAMAGGEMRRLVPCDRVAGRADEFGAGTDLASRTAASAFTRPEPCSVAGAPRSVAELVMIFF